MPLLLFIYFVIKMLLQVMEDLMKQDFEKRKGLVFINMNYLLSYRYVLLGLFYDQGFSLDLTYGTNLVVTK